MNAIIKHLTVDEGLRESCESLTQTSCNADQATFKGITVHYMYASFFARRDALITLPRVVKSRLQSGHAHALRYKGSLDGILTILREEGLDGLYKGVGNKLLQSVLTAAILFAGQKRIYEVTKRVCSSLRRFRVTDAHMI